MNNDLVYAASAAERRALADVLEGLTPEQLATPSWCGGWDVATVGAHLASAITASLPTFVLKMITGRTTFDGANDLIARQAAERPIAVTIDLLRQNAESHFAPPVVGPRAPMTDVLVHSGDIQRPLGLPHDPPADRLRIAFSFLSSPRPIGFIKSGTLRNLRVVAEDIDVEFGSGEELRGRGADVMMAICGRSGALDLLTGPGVESLRSRLPH